MRTRGEPHSWEEVSAPPPCSTVRRRIFVRPLGQPLWPRGRPCHLYHRKEKHEYTWTCLGNRSVCWSEHVYTTGPELHLSCLGNRSVCWSEHVYTIGAWAAPGRIYTTGPELHLSCLDKKILCWSEHVHTIGAWAAPGPIYCTPQEPELHLSCLDKRILCWSGHVYTIRGLCCTWSISTIQGPELHLYLSGQKDSVLVWTCLHYRSLSCPWTYLHYRVICSTWTCLHHRGLCCT